MTPSAFQVTADIIIAVLGVVAASFAVYAARRSAATATKVQEIHLQINSRFDEALKTMRALGDAEGRAAQRDGNGASSG